jgi:HEAT repeat protein
MSALQPTVPGTDEELVQTPEAEATASMNHKRRVNGLINLLKSDYLDSRWKAAEALGELGDPEAVEPPIAALMDLYVDVQWLAAKSPGMIGDMRAVSPLNNILQDSNADVRNAAQEALAALTRGGTKIDSDTSAP